jgi:hypothetical protein
MSNIKILMAVCLLGLAAACSRNAKDRLLGTGDPAESGTGSTTNTASALDNELMQKVAADIQPDLTGTGGGFSALAVSSGCTPGSVTISSTPYTYPPTVYGSSRTYTLNGVSYFTATNWRSSGGTLVFVTEMNGSCFVNSSIYGTLSSQGSSFTQWSPDGLQNKNRWYYHQYTYKYQGDVVVVEGKYTIGTETGSTEYPVNWTFNI